MLIHHQKFLCHQPLLRCLLLPLLIVHSNCSFSCAGAGASTGAGICAGAGTCVGAGTCAGTGVYCLYISAFMRGARW